jgi:hypothetical protein
MPAARQAASLSITASAAARAAVWLGKAWESRASDDPSLAVDALALAHVCRLLCGGSSRIAEAAADAIACAVPAPGWSDTNPLTGLIAAVGASREGGAIASSARQYLRLIAELGQDNLAGANGALVHFALHGVGSGAPVGALPDVQFLYAGDDRRRQFLAGVEAESAFGSRVILAEPPLPALMEGVAIAALRAYDLPLAMRLLRARRYLCDRPSAGTLAGFDFLRFGQCDDGSFGEFDAASAQMAARGDHDGALKLKLPVTLQALWTMAELEDPDFLLIRSVFATPVLSDFLAADVAC